MDNNINQPADKQQYQTLGNKVFWLFFLQMCPVAFMFLLVSIISFILSFQPFLANFPIGNTQKDALLVSLILFSISIVIFASSFVYARMIYKNYVFLVADDSFKIRRGVINKIENAIPYRQIQNVDIERGFLFQMLGLSRLIILTAGHEDENVKGTDEAEGVISAIDQHLAEWLQAELLKRANIQKTVEIDQQ